MLVPTEQLTRPDFASILLVGAPKTWKTGSLGSLHKYLRLHKMPTKIVFFDMDEDGAEPLLRLAREGRELYSDKPGTCEKWISDIELHRYTKAKLVLGPDTKVAPNRSKKMAEDFLNEFNELDNRLDYQTKQWKPGQEIGCIAVDSLTAVQDMYEDFIWLTRNKEIGEAKGPTMIDPGDWRLLGEKVTDVYMTAKQFPCFSFFTAHEDLREEEVRPIALGAPAHTTSHYYKVPLLTKSVAMRLAKDFSIALYTTSDFKWITRPTPSDHVHSAGTRGRDNLDALVTQDFANVLDI
jgi:hypothetical protein